MPLTVAPAGNVLDQVPGAVAVASPSVIVPPTHTAAGPVMAPAAGINGTVMVCCAVSVPQELVAVATMTDDVPPVIPVTTPPEDIVAIAVLLLLQTPPDAPSEKEVVVPIQMLEVPPEIVPASAAALMVILMVATAVPQVLETL